MSVFATPDAIINGLNDAQRAAVVHGDGPLLVIAGAGTGKTKTLVHRVARLIHSGVDPARILLMTFTRRAAAEMLRRVQKLLTEIEHETDDARGIGRAITQRVWGGTFHATATRLLRAYGQLIGLDPAFTIHDRGDSEDFLDVVRTELDLAKDDKRFPRKGTCLSIYSHCVNSQLPIEKVLAEHFPWCADFADELKRLCKAYVDRKDQASVLDYDDLLLFFHGLLADDRAGAKIRERFECVLVDEYQDTNNLQAETLRLLKPDGRGVTVVGDDAQSIYSFRAASVRNILDFPNQFPNVTVVKLEQNYRSTSKILSATNTVIAQSSERFEKNLWSERNDGVAPQLVQCMDEAEQSDFLVRQILSHREAGIDLRRQAVLFRAAHHSILLEADLARAKIPFVKYGGLKFIETAHVKDLMGFLRLAENPRDVVSGSRILMLLPGVGPKRARQLMDVLVASGGRFEAWRDQRVPDEARELWEKLVALMLRLASAGDDQLVPQVSAVRQFYDPLLETKYDQPQPRQRDLEQLEQVAARFSDRATMLAEMALDPPNSTQDLAGEPLLDDDYLILSTMHSAKGLEWDAVYVIHAADGNVPSDMATKSTEQIEEERRLFYVGLTRAKTWLYVCHPLRYYHANRGPKMDRYGMSQLTRFLPKTAV
ncbi:MAG TPA: ATP-dependent helicase, partial [Pirellulaceae bacterium]|nr:ATP-dependent helicase [Pirellulaceae bacterium]